MLATSILCVDEHESCSNLSDILRDVGYQVEFACNTADARACLTVNDYAVGVFVFGTPEVDGIELWKRMKRGQGRHACVVLTEGMLSADLFNEVGRLGECCLLMKPIDVLKMLAFINTFTADPQRKNGATLARSPA